MLTKKSRSYGNAGSKSKHNVATVVLSSASTIALGALIAAAKIYQPDLDPKTLCSTRTQPPVHQAYNIDLTSSWVNEQEPEYVRSEIQKVAETLPVGSRLTVAIIEADREERVVMHKIFDKCRPADGSEQSAVDGNPKKMQKRYEEDYGGDLVKALTALDIAKPTESSPLLELFARHEFFPMTGKLKAVEQRLTIVSDLLQKSEALDQYRNDYQFPSKDKVFIKNIENRLKGVQVKVLLRHNQESQGFHGKKHVNFWTKYFTEISAVAGYEVIAM